MRPSKGTKGHELHRLQVRVFSPYYGAGQILYLVDISVLGVLYPVGYMCTCIRYILLAICVPGTDISCGLYVYLVQIYPVGYMCTWFSYILWANMYLVQIYHVGYMCTWYRYILWAICVPGSDISCGLYVYLVQLYPVG